MKIFKKIIFAALPPPLYDCRNHFFLTEYPTETGRQQKKVQREGGQQQHSPALIHGREQGPRWSGFGGSGGYWSARPLRRPWCLSDGPGRGGPRVSRFELGRNRRGTKTGACYDFHPERGNLFSVLSTRAIFDHMTNRILTISEDILMNFPKI